MAEIPPKPQPRPAAPPPPALKPTPPPPLAPAHAHRVVSLDALRGFDMFWIIGGDKLARAALALWPQPEPKWVQEGMHQLYHTGWAGFTAYDLIMPLFLFVVGAVMPFSFSRRAELGHSRGRMLIKIVSRAIILFILGMAVQGNLLEFNLDTLHPFANTLQAIAVGYLFAGLLLIYTPVWTQVFAAVFLLVLYWLLLRFIPVGGHPAGVMEPDVNVAIAVDRWVLGRFIDGTNPPYAWILAGLTFTASVLLGVFSGHLLRSKSAPIMKFAWLALLGAACLGGGWAWAQYGGFPIIKHIWTSTMVLWAGGWCYLLLAAFYLVFDLFGLRMLAFPLVVIGMNAIVAYVAYHLVIPFDAISARLMGGVARQLGRAAGHFAPHLESAMSPFVLALTSVLLAWLLLYHLYRRKIFLRI